MSFLFRLRCLNLFIKVVFPDRHRLDTPTGSTRVRRSESAAAQARRFVRPPGGVPDFVDDLEEDEVVDRWKEYVDDVNVIENTRSFLEHTWKQ